MYENPIKYTYFWLRNRYLTWRGKIAKAKYMILCKLRHHITTEECHYYSNLFGPGPYLEKKIPKWLKFCPRCGTRVNTGLDDEYFLGKRS